MDIDFTGAFIALAVLGFIFGAAVVGFIWLLISIL